MPASLFDAPLGLRTDLLVGPASLVVTPAEGCLVLRTLDRADFHMGNALYLPAPPEALEVDRLLERWQIEFAEAARVSRVVLQWESPAAEKVDLTALIESATARGLEFERNVVMRLDRLIPAEAHAPLRARPVAGQDDWAAVLAVATASDESAGLRAFKAWRQVEYQRLVEAGQGRWWMGELDGQVVTSAGIFWDDAQQLARFQRVDTRPEVRGRGCATGLLSAMLADVVVQRPWLLDIVIVAALGGQAERIYRRLGFEPRTHQDALMGDRQRAISRLCSC